MTNENRQPTAAELNRRVRAAQAEASFARRQVFEARAALRRAIRIHLAWHVRRLADRLAWGKTR